MENKETTFKAIETIANAFDTVTECNETKATVLNRLNDVEQAKAKVLNVMADFDTVKFDTEIETLNEKLSAIEGEFSLETLNDSILKAFNAIPENVLNALLYARKLANPKVSNGNTGGRKGKAVTVEFLDGTSKTFDSGAHAMRELDCEQWQGTGENASKAWRSHAFDSKGNVHKRFADTVKAFVEAEA